ncbi:MAG: hypothetical protein JXR94_05575 [Candidatus Hydrogenedentes bacterium]|nr:hypothetical protein [Candidatus Hydrogenedentota bacterium]
MPKLTLPELPSIVDLGDGPLYTVLEYVLYFLYLIFWFLTPLISSLAP